MNLKELAKAITTASNALHNSEKFPLYGLALRATKAAEQHPYDPSLVTASKVLSKMAESQAFISRQELNSLYNTLYTSNSKLGDVFASELDRNVLKTPTIYNRAGEGESQVNDFEMVADPVLSNALASAFEGTGQIRSYSKKVGERAEKVCKAELLDIGLEPKSVKVFAGQEDMIICEASYETPKGPTNVLIPVEVKGEQALFPTMFLTQHGFVDLETNKLASHVTSMAGKSVAVDGGKLLKVLSEAKNGVKKVASDVEMAVIQMKAQKGQPDFGNGIVGLKPFEVEAGVEDPELEKTAEHYEFSKRVTNPAGAAAFVFGERAVVIGRDALVRKMAEFGYRNVQVKVADVKDSEIHYAVGVGVNAAILAPIKIRDGVVQPPSIAIASGKVTNFDKAGISELVSATRPDTRMLAVASPSYGLKAEELLEQVKIAVAEGNLTKAEDAINVLGEVDKHYQKIAIAMLVKGVSGGEESDLEKIASEKPQDVPFMSTYQIFYPSEGK